MLDHVSNDLAQECLLGPWHGERLVQALFADGCQAGLCADAGTGEQGLDGLSCGIVFGFELGPLVQFAVGGSQEPTRMIFSAKTCGAVKLVMAATVAPNSK